MAPPETDQKLGSPPQPVRSLPLKSTWQSAWSSAVALGKKPMYNTYKARTILATSFILPYPQKNFENQDFKSVAVPATAKRGSLVLQRPTLAILRLDKGICLFAIRDFYILTVPL